MSCSICGEEGHNVTTCPAAVGVGGHASTVGMKVDEIETKGRKLKASGSHADAPERKQATHEHADEQVDKEFEKCDDKDEKKMLMKEKEQLRDEKKQLREEKKQLRELLIVKEKQLLQQQQPAQQGNHITHPLTNH